MAYTPIISIVKSYVRRNPETGATCSVFGAVPPGYSERVFRGWTFEIVRNGSVTRGIGKPPFKTKEEAEKYLADNFSNFSRG
jgi:hypothetical protein